jgi:YHS domain-containing protein
MKNLPALFAAAALLLGGASLARADDAHAPAVALKGVDPVTYFNPGKPAKGEAGISYEFDDARYLFVSEKNRATFAADPERYAPQFGGLCAAGLSAGAHATADPRVFKIVDGKLYVFSSVAARAKADKDATMLKRAQEVWRREHR